MIQRFSLYRHDANDAENQSIQNRHDANDTENQSIQA